MKLSHALLAVAGVGMVALSAIYVETAPDHKPGKVVCRVTLAQDIKPVEHNDGYTARDIYVPWRGLGFALRRDQYMASEPAQFTRINPSN